MPDTPLGPLASAFGATQYVVGDVLMLAAEPDEARFSILKREDVDRAAGSMLTFSDARLLLGAALGPLGSPFILPMGGRRRRYLRENGAGRWAAKTTFWGYGLFNVLAPVIHGSFFQWALLLKAAQREADRPGNEFATDRAVAKATKFNNRLEKVYLLAFAGLISASVAEGVSIARGKSRFPAWSAPLVTPAVPMIVATAATANGTGRHPAWRSLQGAGFSLGEVIAFTAEAFLSRKPRKPRGPRTR